MTKPNKNTATATATATAAINYYDAATIASELKRIVDSEESAASIWKEQARLIAHIAGDLPAVLTAMCAAYSAIGLVPIADKDVSKGADERRIAPAGRILESSIKARVRDAYGVAGLITSTIDHIDSVESMLRAANLKGKVNQHMAAIGRFAREFGFIPADFAWMASKDGPDIGETLASRESRLAQECKGMVSDLRDARKSFTDGDTLATLDAEIAAYTAAEATHKGKSEAYSALAATSAEKRKATLENQRKARGAIRKDGDVVIRETAKKAAPAPLGLAAMLAKQK
jgi:hypothetical protein